MSFTVSLLLGFIFLFFGGELLVRGSVALALRIRISTLVVGMTVVSFATSSPELFVSLKAVLSGSNDIAFGNVIGSNIANIAFVLAITAIIFRVKIAEQTMNINYPFLLFSSLLFGVVLYYFNGLPRTLGCFFFLVLLVFICFLIQRSRKSHLGNIDEDELLRDAKHASLLKSLGFLIIGVGLLKYGADYLVDGIIAVAKRFDISERIISVTLVAIGTSIPELATSIIAAIKKENNLVVGNLIGSNIFNILAVLGLVAAVKEITIIDYAIFSYDYVWMIIITFILGLFIYLFSKQNISRRKGFCLLVLYVLYLYFSIN